MSALIIYDKTAYWVNKETSFDFSAHNMSFLSKNGISCRKFKFLENIKIHSFHGRIYVCKGWVHLKDI